MNYRIDLYKDDNFFQYPNVASAINIADSYNLSVFSDCCNTEENDQDQDLNYKEMFMGFLWMLFPLLASSYYGD